MTETALSLPTVRPLDVARVFACVALAFVISMFYRAANGVIAPELMAELAMDPSTMGFVTGMFFLVFAAGQIPVGMAVERFGLRSVHRYGHVAELLFTFGLAYLIEEAVHLIWGRSSLDYRVPPDLDGPLFTIYGSAYRVIVCDEKGNNVDGDHIIAICAIYLKEKGALIKNCVVTTIMTNKGFDIAMAKKNIHVFKTKVGDRYVIDEMRKQGYVLGGEQSGHIIFSDYTTTGDGIISALQLLRIMKEKGEKLSNLKICMKSLPQVLINVKVKEKRDIDTLEVKKLIRKTEEKLGKKERVLVRYSGTENLCRVMIEGEQKKEIQKNGHTSWQSSQP